MDNRTVKIVRSEKRLIVLCRDKKIKKIKFPTLNISDLDAIIDIVEPHQEGSRDMGVGIRGLYKDEINKQYLRQSRVWVDGTPTKEGLTGTSAIEVVHDWYSSSRKDVQDGLYNAADLVDNYSAVDKYALVIGEPQNGAEDEGEIILSARTNPFGGAEVVAYINIKS